MKHIIIILFIIISSQYLYADEYTNTCNQDDERIYFDGNEGNEKLTELDEDNASKTYDACNPNDYNAQYYLGAAILNCTTDGCLTCCDYLPKYRYCHREQMTHGESETMCLMDESCNNDEFVQECLKLYDPDDIDGDGWPNFIDPFPEDPSKMLYNPDKYQEDENGNVTWLKMDFSSTGGGGQSNIEFGTKDEDKDTYIFADNIEENSEDCDFECFKENYVQVEEGTPQEGGLNGDSSISGNDTEENNSPVNNSNDSTLLNDIANSNRAIQNNQRDMEEQLRNNTEVLADKLKVTNQNVSETNDKLSETNNKLDQLKTAVEGIDTGGSGGTGATATDIANETSSAIEANEQARYDEMGQEAEQAQSSLNDLDINQYTSQLDSSLTEGTDYHQAENFSNKSWYQNFLNNPLKQALDNTQIDLTNAYCDVNVNLGGNIGNVNLSMCGMQSSVEKFGILLLSITTLGSIVFVMRG